MRRILTIFAALAICGWVGGNFILTNCTFYALSFGGFRGGVVLAVNDSPPKDDCWSFRTRDPIGPFWAWPDGLLYVHSDAISDSVAIIFLPHWLTNVVAWAVLFIFWHKSRKPPEGHCQRCGYDLTGNESGRCPECDHRIETTANTD